MTAPWVVDSIQAGLQLVTVNTAGRALPSSGELTVWTPAQLSIDGPGSIYPATFLNRDMKPGYIARLTISGTCQFPATWQQKKYTLTASLGPTRVLERTGIDVPTRNDPYNVKANGMSLLSTNLATPCPLPFRWAGDFTWTITLETAPKTVLTAARTTRLELCWARAAASKGPVEPRTNERSRVNFGAGYPIAAFRLFSPSPLEFQGQNDLLRWYITRAMNIVWNWTLPGRILRYDTVTGSTKYGQYPPEGTFDLAAWMTIKHLTLSCHDLAAVSQLACAVLVGDTGEELLDSKWVYQEPNGFILPGPLYGWAGAGGDNDRCNNPFWDNASYTRTPYTTPADTKRSLFKQHSWIEVHFTPGDGRVLDATHVLQANPKPESGARNRAAYLNATQDPTRAAGNGNARPQTPQDPAGSCMQNPETQTSRIGLRGITGQPAAALQIGALAVSESRRVDLEEVWDRGRSSTAREATFNTAPVHEQALLAFFPESIFRHDDTTISIEPALTRQYMRFKPRSAQDANFEEVTLRIQVFDSLTQPISTLRAHQMGIQAGPLVSIVDQLETPLGSHSYHVPGSVFWVRGNQFIIIDEYRTSEHTEHGTWSLLEIARTLDNHLANPTQRAQSAPRIAFDSTTLPGHICAGDEFRAKIRETAPLLQSKHAFSDNTDIVLPAGPVSEEMDFVCYAVGVGKTNVRVCVADAVTLMPEQVVFEVEVEAGPEVVDLYAQI